MTISMRAVNRKFKRILSFLRSDISLFNWLRIGWLLAVFWCEFGLFEYSISTCGWGDKQLSKSTVAPTHVLLVTDPQVRDISPKKHGLLSRLERWVYHATLRKNWKYASQLKPDAVIFLGDILASGRKIKDDEEYSNSVRRFRDIFSLDNAVAAYFVPGNEDVGLNLKADSARQARHHYEQYFGPANRKVSIADHTFILLDSPLLVEEDYHRAGLSRDYDQWKADEDGSVEFIRSFKDEAKLFSRHPVVLLTHIPLYRPSVAPCGPLRERDTIHKGAGPGYQNMLGKLTTQFIFENIRPSIVFSGDDRDYCDYTHMFTHTENTTAVDFIREVTVKSFSMSKHIKNPGFHLLSIIPPSSVSVLVRHGARTLSDSPCFLPAQSSIYTSVYMPFFVFTFLLLLVANYRQPRSRYQPLLPSPMSVSKRTSPSILTTTYFSQNEKYADTARSSPSSSPSVGGQSRLLWPLTLFRSRSGHARRSSGVGWKEAGELSSRNHSSSQVHPVMHAMHGALVNLLVVVTPSLLLWTLITWWTLR